MQETQPVDAGPVSDKTVLMLGAFSHEGLTAKLRGLGLSLVRKHLWSSAKNWLKIVELIKELRAAGRLLAVIVYAPTPTLLHISEPIYEEVRDQLLSELEATTTFVFLHEDSFTARIEPAPWEISTLSDEDLERMDIPWPDVPPRDDDGPPASLSRFRKDPTREEWLEENADRIARAVSVFAELQRRRISLVPFRTRSDVTIRLFEVLEDAEAGIFLRVYVPHGRYQSEQFEDFLTMFSRYLREVEGKEFSIGTDRTARGTTYTFKGRGEVINVGGLDEAISRFDAFLSLAESDPKAAEAVLTTAGCASSHAPFIVSKYVRQNRRLAMEIRHEHDRRRLQIQQEMESELLDANDSQLLPVPDARAPSSLLSIIGNSGSVSLHLHDSVIGGQVGQAIFGNVTYTAEDEAVLSLIETLTDKVEALQLRSDLDRLKDKATQPEERRTAVQRLKAFLYATGKSAVSKAGEIGTQLLIKYLERQIDEMAP